MGGVALAMSVCVAMLNLGCTNWVAIRPSELPRLNGSTAVRAGTTYDLEPIMLIAETSVETPEGTLVTIRGDFDASIQYHGRTILAEDPVISEVTGSYLQVRAGNLRQTRMTLAEITSVEVLQAAGTKTYLLTVGLILLGSMLVGGLTYAVTADRTVFQMTSRAACPYWRA